jgi:hypothetical protein
MHELSQRKVHGFWANLKCMFFPWSKAEAPETSASPKTEGNKLAGFQPGNTIAGIMLTLAIFGMIAAGYFAYRYGAF